MHPIYKKVCSNHVQIHIESMANVWLVTLVQKKIDFFFQKSKKIFLPSPKKKRVNCFFFKLQQKIFSRKIVPAFEVGTCTFVFSIYVVITFYSFFLIIIFFWNMPAKEGKYLHTIESKPPSFPSLSFSFKAKNPRFDEFSSF